VHLRCTNHLRQNIKEKLRSLELSQELSKDIMADIFGRQIGVHFEKGLVDAENKKLFLAYLKSVTQKWNRSSNPENFTLGFVVKRQQSSLILKSDSKYT